MIGCVWPVGQAVMNVFAVGDGALSLKSLDGRDLKLALTEKTTVAAAKALKLEDLGKADLIGAQELAGLPVLERLVDVQRGDTTGNRLVGRAVDEQRRLLEAAERSGGRIISFCTVNPSQGKEAVADSGIDFAASATYKWLMGDFGLAFFFVREELLGRPVSMSIDFHSGFGLRDRIWFPYARSRRPMRSASR